MRKMMRNIAVFCAGLLFVFSAACSVQTNQPATVPSTPTSNQNVTGVFTGVRVAGGNATVSVQTGGKTQGYVLSPNTTITLGGKACSIDDLAAIQSGNTSYNCTVVYNDAMGVFGVYVTGGTAK